MSDDSEGEGIPIYLDPLDRKLVDSTGEVAGPDEWHPSNPAADRLLKCREALHDIQEVLESYRLAKASSKKRRRLRALFVPLHSLSVGIIDLMNQIQSDKTFHDRIPDGATSTITKLRTYFVEHVPFDRKGKLGRLRNKLAAHYETSMSPAEMRDLLNSTDSTEVGEWFHISLGVLCDLIKLDAYSWYAEGPEEGMTTTMCQEPLVSVWRVEDSKMVGLEGMFMCKESPKKSYVEQLQEVAEISQCLFERPCKYRIDGFYQDSGKDWARSLSPKPDS